MIASLIPTAAASDSKKPDSQTHRRPRDPPLRIILIRKFISRRKFAKDICMFWFKSIYRSATTAQVACGYLCPMSKDSTAPPVFS